MVDLLWHPTDPARDLKRRGGRRLGRMQDGLARGGFEPIVVKCIELFNNRFNERRITIYWARRT
jgi:hypothetical protein